jgi:hypothetical protein
MLVPGARFSIRSGRFGIEPAVWTKGRDSLRAVRSVLIDGRSELVNKTSGSPPLRRNRASQKSVVASVPPQSFVANEAPSVSHVSILMTKRIDNAIDKIIW